MTDYHSGHEQSDRQYAQAVEDGVRLGRMILRVEAAIAWQLRQARLRLSRMIAATRRHTDSSSKVGQPGDLL